MSFIANTDIAWNLSNSISSSVIGGTGSAASSIYTPISPKFIMLTIPWLESFEFLSYNITPLLLYIGLASLMPGLRSSDFTNNIFIPHLSSFWMPSSKSRKH